MSKYIANVFRGAANTIDSVSFGKVVAFNQYIVKRDWSWTKTKQALSTRSDDGTQHEVKYYTLEVDGVSVKFDDWRRDSCDASYERVRLWCAGIGALGGVLYGMNKEAKRRYSSSTTIVCSSIFGGLFGGVLGATPYIALPLITLTTIGTQLQQYHNKYD